VRKNLANKGDVMPNSVIVYKSRRDQMMDEFWMSEEGTNIIVGGLIFLVIFLLVAVNKK
jgi:hypothetical protein